MPRNRRNPTPLKVSVETKREAFMLCWAIEEIVYYPERTITGGLLALAGAFLGLVRESRAGEPEEVFKALVDYLRSQPGLPEDDPVFRDYVHPPHEPVQ